eukprot:TRINITY_DN2887_c0_g1_i11.p1 TRINITY_DN2887_c0_g1~~TRINITY_DN2887_c0_g1_i11.p1  ORF type:complete len:131 (+),score=29.47 TRINITY_DN2887_c0_g1_i11:160-552(+)
MGLHSCGSATDLILEQCQKKRANFVVCPCCFGFMQNELSTDFPRSQVFSEVGLTSQDYHVLAAGADMTYYEGDTTDAHNENREAGKLCMSLVNMDRKLWVEESGWEVRLCRMNPESCTPKNEILVGTAPA